MAVIMWKGLDVLEYSLLITYLRELFHHSSKAFASMTIILMLMIHKYVKDNYLTFTSYYDM